MSITVVSTPPMPTQVSATDSGSDGTATQDFANLLQGQLATNAPSVAAAPPPTNLPTTDATLAETTPIDATSLLLKLGLAATPADANQTDKALAEKTESDVAPTDAAASLLAALGLVATPSGVPAHSSGNAEQKTDDPLAAVSGMTGEKAEELPVAASGTTGQKTDEPQPAVSETTEPKAEELLAATSGTTGLKTDKPQPAVAETTGPKAEELRAAASGTTGLKTDEPQAAVPETTEKNTLTAGQPGSLKYEPTIAATIIANDKAAKFAVISAPSEKAASTEPVAGDTPPATIIVQSSSNAPPHANNVNTKNDSSLPVTTHLRDKVWASDFGQKIVWLASNEKQSAQLTLNPPQMGPIEVSLDVDKGNASVSFASANAEVRDAIETALPRLREMFASAGIELGQTNVGAQSFSQQQSGSNEQNQSSSRWMDDNAILAAETTGSLQTGVLSARQGNGMVDLFA